jgi:hypothetical protein
MPARRGRIGGCGALPSGRRPTRSHVQARVSRRDPRTRPELRPTGMVMVLVLCRVVVAIECFSLARCDIKKMRVSRSTRFEIVRRFLPAVADHFVFDHLTLVERSQTGALDRGDMDEYVSAAVLRRNESITIRRVEPFHGASFAVKREAKLTGSPKARIAVRPNQAHTRSRRSPTRRRERWQRSASSIIEEASENP